MARTQKSDKVLFVTVLVLVCVGAVMVLSATVMSSVRQLAWVTAGVLAMLVAMRTDYHYLRQPTVIWSILGVTVLGLIAVYFFPDRNGAHRWIRVGPVNWQPSELAKLAAIVFAAAVLERRMHRINDFGHTLAPIAIVTGVLALLIVNEPDLGTATVVVMVVTAMLFAAGLSWRYLAASAMLAVPVLTLFIVLYPWRLARLLAFMTPDDAVIADKAVLAARYQLQQSQIALGSGGVSGLGLGNSAQKLYFLPEKDNDFIFAIIGEEFGLIGTTVMVLCFAIIAWRGFRAALLAPDRFGTLLGIGIAALVGIQAFVNMSVVTGLAPTKGITLPLVSSGGSALVMTLIGMGILLNISQQSSKAAAAAVDAR